MGYQQFNQEFEPSFTNPSWKPVQYVGLRLDIPVFSGFARSNAVKNARLNLHTMQSSFAYVESKAAQDDKNLLAEFYANKEKAGNAAEIRDLYLSNYTLAGQRYREGVSNTDQYLQAFTDYLSGQSRYIAAVADYYVSKAKIQNRIHSK
ncbi:MAG: TolC family protein [Bacteroidales bacterium]|nr:TolC family protein [Bacteroidales bacterium]